MSNEREWATEPLLDPGNVDKYVLVSWNGNHPTKSKITKIGRTNITTQEGWSMKVSGGEARGTSGGYGLHAMTQERHRETEEMKGLTASLRVFDWGTLDRPALEAVVAIIKEAKS